MLPGFFDLASLEGNGSFFGDAFKARKLESKERGDENEETDGNPNHYARRSAIVATGIRDCGRARCNSVGWRQSVIIERRYEDLQVQGSA